MTKKEIISSENAPKAIGPYSPAVIFGGLIFTAGQLGIIPQTGELADGGIEFQTRQALMNIRILLEAAGSSTNNILKTTVYLKDMNDFNVMNKVYSEFFNADFPSRTTIAVAGLPKNGLVEIEAIAYK